LCCRDITDGLTCIENQPMTELRYIDIGLGHQSVRLEFDTMCSSYSLIFRDVERCHSFISVLTGNILQQYFSLLGVLVSLMHLLSMIETNHQVKEIFNYFEFIHFALRTFEAWKHFLINCICKLQRLSRVRLLMRRVSWNRSVNLTPARSVTYRTRSGGSSNKISPTTTISSIWSSTCQEHWYQVCVFLASVIATAER
jgi:hypothetical protein